MMDANFMLARPKELKKAMRKHFRQAFGNQCLPPDPLDGREDLVFGMECREWIIKTSFDVGRWEPEISFEHNVWTGKWITREEPAVLFANCLGFRLNYGNEIGIGSGWECLSPEEVNPAYEAVLDHCGKMFEAFSELLKGLEQSKLSP